MPALPSPFPSVIRNKGRLLLGRQNFVIGGAKEKGRERERERHGVAHSERSATCIRFGVEARQDPLSGKVHTGRSVPPSLAPTSLGGRLSQPFLPFFQCRTHWLEEGPLLSLSLSLRAIDVGTTRAINLERRSLLGNMPARIPNAHNRRVTSSTTTLRFSPR